MELALLDHTLNRIRSPCGLNILAVRIGNDNLVAFASVSSESLALTACVMSDNFICCSKYCCRRSVVLLELDDGGTAPGLVEAQNVLDRGSAEAVYAYFRGNEKSKDAEDNTDA